VSAAPSGSDVPPDAAPRALPRGAFDLVFDMQCFHVLREGSAAHEEHAARVVHDLLKAGGTAVVVVGACVPDGGSAAGATGTLGPPQLAQADLVRPLSATGLTLESITLTKFNTTPHYDAMPGGPPQAWVGVFRKPDPPREKVACV